MSIKKLDQLISKLEHTKGGTIRDFAGGRRPRGRPRGSGLTGGGTRRTRRMHHQATCGGIIQDFTGSGRRRYVRRISSWGI